MTCRGRVFSREEGVMHRQSRKQHDQHMAVAMQHGHVAAANSVQCPGRPRNAGVANAQPGICDPKRGGTPDE